MLSSSIVGQYRFWYWWQCVAANDTLDLYDMKEQKYCAVCSCPMIKQAYDVEFTQTVGRAAAIKGCFTGLLFKKYVMVIRGCAQLNDKSHDMKDISRSTENNTGPVLHLCFWRVCAVLMLNVSCLILPLMSYCFMMIITIIGTYMSIAKFSSTDSGFLKFGISGSAIAHLSGCFCLWTFY